jgi:hypothetical protein
MSERDHADDLLEAASLYALGALDPADARNLEFRLMQGDGPLRAELEAFAPVVARLGHAAPPIPPARAVRARLLKAVRASSHLTIVRAAEGVWAPTPAGILAKGLLRDPIGGRATTLVSMRGGSVYPSHRHRDTEELYILEGSLDVHGYRLGPGDYCAALEGSVHRSASTPAGCRFLASGSEEDELLGSAEPSRRGLLFVPDGRGSWHSAEPGVAVRRLALDPHLGVATVVVRMAPGSRGPVRGRQMYVLDGAARLTVGGPLRTGDFCGTLTGTIEVADSPTGCLLLVLAARGAIAQEVGP